MISLQQVAALVRAFISKVDHPRPFQTAFFSFLYLVTFSLLVENTYSYEVISPVVSVR